MTAPTTTRGFPDAVNDLVDGPTATRTLASAGLEIAAAHPDYLRHKPGETTIVSYRFDLPGQTDPAFGYAHWCRSIARADDVHTKALSLRPRPSAVGVSVVRIDEHTVFYGFPNDARLRRLRWYSSARKLKRVLDPLVPVGQRMSKRQSSVSVLKYKPERRLVARVDLVTREGGRASYLLRYTTAGQAAQLAAVAQALLAAGVDTPRPRCQLDGGRVGLDDFVAGEELRSFVRSGGSAAEALADSLAAFHRAAAPPGTPARDETADLVNAWRGLDALSERLPSAKALVADVARRLARTRPTSQLRGLIHGDLHDKNVLIDGDRAWFIDLERAAVGAPMSDLGRLRAHALSLGIRQPGWSPGAVAHADETIEAYRHLAGGPGGRLDDGLSWHCAVALIDQALLVSRHLEQDWETSAALLLMEAHRQLTVSRADVA